MLTASGYYGVMQAFQSTHEPGDCLAWLSPAVLGSSRLSSSTQRSLLRPSLYTRGRGPWTYGPTFPWMLHYQVILGILALSRPFAYDRWDVAGLAILLAPPAMARLAVKQYIELGGPLRVASVAFPGADASARSSQPTTR